MEEKNMLNTENCQAVMDWLNGKSESEPEFATAFMTLFYLKYMDKKGPLATPGRRRTPLNIEGIPSLKRMMTQIEKETAQKKENEQKVEPPIEPEANKETPIQETLFTEQQTESEDNQPTKESETPQIKMKASVIGKAVKHCSRLHEIKLSISHIQLIMYVLYGYRLANDMEDVFNESPQMWKYGPVFASSFSQLKKGEDIQSEYEAWKAVNRHDLNLGTQIISLVTGLGERNVKELSAKHTAHGTPWHDCRVMNPDKWGTAIPAETIKQWFKQNDKKNK